MERSIDLVVALLAVLKTGAAFVPLDPTQPFDRMWQIAQDGGLAAIVTGKAPLPLLSQLPLPIVSEPSGSVHVAKPEVNISLDNAAYVYYTSGSTGAPKGVVLDHRAAMNRLEWLKRRYPLSSGNRVIHKTPLIFDVSIWEIFGTLSAGATILLADAGREADVAHVGSLLSTPGTVFAHFVPSMLDAYLICTPPRKYPHLRWVQVSGEALPTRVVERFSGHFAAELHNLYGQTETSEVAGWEGRMCTGLSGAPIGKQIGIYRLYVLDESLTPVPPDVPGELCVAGLGGLARGYHGLAGLTAEKFVPNPFAVRSGERLYRTGDLVVVDEDGLLRFRGRIDEQTKIRGCRVEIGEIELIVSRHASVRACAVVSRQDESGSNELIAYVVGDRNALDELAAHVEGHLPRYMHPAVYVYLTGALTVTSSGKLNRRALPAPQPSDREARMTNQPPCGALEKQIAEKWKQVLQLESVGRTANFFTIGGNSLKCNQVLSWISASFDIEVKIRDFFLAPTIEGLARAMKKSAVEMVETLCDDEVQFYLRGSTNEHVDPGYGNAACVGKGATCRADSRSACSRALNG